MRTVNIRRSRRFSSFWGVFFLGVALCLAVIADASIVQGAQDRERILLFDATAVLNPSGAMEVTEKITVRSTEDRIVRGIFRTLPVIWRRGDGRRFKMGYDIHSVLRDGAGEAYSVSRSNEWITVRMGRKDVRLEPGVHEYTITYTVRNHFSRFPGWEELYWNVTGNDWDFSIDKARFRLLFRESPDAAPVPMPMRSLDLYTGRLDEKGSNACQLPDGTIETVTPLARSEGLTIAWTWPPGLLADAPDPAEYSFARVLFLPTSKTFPVLIMPLWIGAYFFFICRKRRSGSPPTVIPLFAVPEGFTPGALRYVVNKRYDGTAFAADLLNLVSKGAVSLGPQPDKPVLKLGGSGKKALQAEEREALNRLFSRDRSISLTRSNASGFREARRSFSTHCLRQEKQLFLPVVWIAVFGALQAVALLIGVTMYFPYSGSVLLSSMVVFSSIWVSVLLLFTVTMLGDVSGLRDLLSRIPFLLFILPFWGAIAVIWILSAPAVFLDPDMPEGLLGAFFATALVFLLGCCILPRRTAEGLRRLSIAKGLAMYLGTAERDRFAALYPPTESVQHFEELLPYALALGEGKTWANRFERYMQETGAFSEVYAAEPWTAVQRFSSGVSSVSAPPRSSGGGSGGRSGSGSSGGGSSGRGAGGGGGGGW